MASKVLREGSRPLQASGFIAALHTLVILLGQSPSAEAQANFKYVTREDMIRYRDWVATLPPAPAPQPPLPEDEVFRWDQVLEPDPTAPGAFLSVDYTTPSYSQSGGTCFLFASIGAMEIRASIDSTTWWYWGAETQRGVRLSALDLWDCDDLIGSLSGVASEPLAWVEHHGVVEDCLDPYQPPLPALRQSFEDRPACPNCDAYLAEFAHPYGPNDPDDPRSACSPWQRASSRVLYYHHSGALAVPDHSSGTRAALEGLAASIRQGPVISGVWYDSGSTREECNHTTSSGGGHFIVLIGYDISGENDLLLVRNSHVAEEAPWYIHYYEWVGPAWDNAGNRLPGCGIGDRDVQPGRFTEPHPISLEAEDAPEVGLNFHDDPRRICEMDPDQDGVGLLQDNCRGVGNPGQTDQDGDGIGDACDSDIDGDGFPNDRDCNPYDPSLNDDDMDEDGVCDEYDCDQLNPELHTDIDGDGVCDKLHWPAQDSYGW